MSSSVLTSRLEDMVATGLLERRAYREPGQQERHEYALTEKGSDLYPALNALRDWGDEYVADPDGPAMLVPIATVARRSTSLWCARKGTPSRA